MTEALAAHNRELAQKMKDFLADYGPGEAISVDVESIFYESIGGNVVCILTGPTHCDPWQVLETGLMETDDLLFLDFRFELRAEETAIRWAIANLLNGRPNLIHVR